jgi:hypothetical protein
LAHKHILPNSLGKSLLQCNIHFIHKLHTGLAATC